VRVFFGMTRTGNISASQLTRDCRPHRCFRSAWMDREIFGWERMAMGWTGLKEKSLAPPPNCIVGGTIAVQDAQGGLWTAFNAQGVTYWLANGTQDLVWDGPLMPGRYW